jgi:lysophospholipase L1-like esterase
MQKASETDKLLCGWRFDARVRLLRKILCLGAVLVVALSASESQAVDRDTMKRLGINGQFNRIQFYDRSAVKGFQDAWRHVSSKGLRILHVGDSHVQHGIVAKGLRKYLNVRFSDGGHGLIFPYSTAKTYSPRAYNSKHTGEWTYGKSRVLPAKVPLAVSGMSAHTTDEEASFTITFRKRVPLHWKQLRLFVKRSRQSFDVEIETGGYRIPLRIGPVRSSKDPGYRSVRLPNVGNSITVRVVKRRSYQEEFEIYGMSLESVRKGGVVVHNGGVGASRYRAILYQEHFEQQLPWLNPDMVIVDYGTNDYLYDDTIKDKLESQIRKVVARIRNAVPKATIVLTTAHDLYFRQRNVTSGVHFSDLIHRIAKDTGCAVYDWYWIAGGGRAMRRWHEEKHAQRDLIHLNGRGYRLKAHLLAEALTFTAKYLNGYPKKNTLLVDRGPFKERLRNLPPEPEPEETTASKSTKRKATRREKRSKKRSRSKQVLYRVKSGDTLSTIARKYKVDWRDIQKWNRLRGTVIHQGKSLVIYPKK